MSLGFKNNTSKNNTITSLNSFNLRGEWSATPSDPYLKFDVVVINGSSYVAKFDNLITNPETIPSDWQLVAKKGDLPSTISGTILPTDSPSGTGVKCWFTFKAGTYTNFGGLVVNENSFAIIVRDVNGAFSISQMTIGISGKLNISDVVDNLYTTEPLKALSANQGSILSKSLTLIEKGSFALTNIKSRIKPKTVSVYGANTLDHKTAETWYKGIVSKTINTISVPIVRPFYSNLSFTDSVIVRVAVNGKFILNKTITLDEINAGGFNSTTSATAIDSFYFDIALPLFELKANDVIYVGIGCKGATDKQGFTYSEDSTNEWGDRIYIRSTTNILSYTDAPVKPVNGTYSLAIRFGYNDYQIEKIKGRLNPESVISINSRNINSFIGGVNTVIDALIAAKPKARFVFLTHFTEDGILGNRSCENLIKAQIALAEYWGTDILVLSKKLNWIKKNGKNTLISNVPDELHPATDSTLESVYKIKRYVKQFLNPMFDSWSGKKIAWYGTSIPYGHPVNETSARYPDLAVNELGGICLNKSWPGSVIRRNKFDGTSMSLSFLDTSAPKNYQQDMINLIGTSNEPDLFVFDFGINDWTFDPTDFEFDNRIK